MSNKNKKVSVKWKEEVTVINNTDNIEKNTLSDKSSKLKYLDYKENNIARTYQTDLLLKNLIITDKK